MKIASLSWTLQDLHNINWSYIISSCKAKPLLCPASGQPNASLPFLQSVHFHSLAFRVIELPCKVNSRGHNIPKSSPNGRGPRRTAVPIIITTRKANAVSDFDTSSITSREFVVNIQLN
ncbi:hypothetical protein BgiBS90_024603 [Biomphalaria glabrata]|nr:hypothetical protein BgiBS90_024603 [Biomphalaria glabrata]